MSNSLTPEEVKQEYIEKMGQPIGECFYSLWNEIVFIYTKWSEFLALYVEKPKRIELLNQVAPSFFRITQDLIWENILLSIARITDVPKSQKDKFNLTILQFPELITDQKFRNELLPLIKTAIESSDFCRDWRNRHIAHRDYYLAVNQSVTPLKEATVAKVRVALSSICKVMNTVDYFYRETTTHFEVGNIPGGIYSLLYVMNDGLKYDAERERRFENDECREDDFIKEDI